MAIKMERDFLNCHPAPLKLRPYGAIEIQLSLLLLLSIYFEISSAAHMHNIVIVEISYFFSGKYSKSLQFSGSYLWYSLCCVKSANSCDSFTKKRSRLFFYIVFQFYKYFCILYTVIHFSPFFCHAVTLIWSCCSCVHDELCYMLIFPGKWVNFLYRDYPLSFLITPFNIIFCSLYVYV